MHALMDSSRVGSESLTRNFPALLELLADVVLHPTFLQTEIDRVRSEREATLVQEKDDPFSVATRVYSIALYGPKYTYGYPDIGTAESLNPLNAKNGPHSGGKAIFPVTGRLPSPARRNWRI